jgi:hypothetical protein
LSELCESAKIAELPEERELPRRWLAEFGFFMPCLVAGFKPAGQLFFYQKPSNPEDASENCLQAISKD